MKNLKLFVAVVMVVLNTGISSLSASETAKKPEVNQIMNYLSRVDYSDVIKSDMKLSITFMVNHQNEIIVVSTNRPELDNVIKTALNYKKVDMDLLQYNILYTLPVTIKS